MLNYDESSAKKNPAGGVTVWHHRIFQKKVLESRYSIFVMWCGWKLAKQSQLRRTFKRICLSEWELWDNVYPIFDLICQQNHKKQKDLKKENRIVSNNFKLNAVLWLIYLDNQRSKEEENASPQFWDSCNPENTVPSRIPFHFGEIILFWLGE